MTVKEHYDTHLGNFYSWFTGDFEKNKEDFRNFCIENEIKPEQSSYAIDLGAGNGIQTIALASLGFRVNAIDFNKQLVAELETKIGQYPIKIFIDDIRLVTKYSGPQPELIVCCGDTLAHLGSFAEIQTLINDSFHTLLPYGKIILTFRDYSIALDDTSRFIPVKSDAQRIFTCLLEYFPDKVRVTDLLYELENGVWIQKVSSYTKTRITKNVVISYLKKAGFEIVADKNINRMEAIIAQRI